MVHKIRASMVYKNQRMFNNFPRAKVIDDLGKLLVKKRIFGFFIKLFSLFCLEVSVCFVLFQVPCGTFGRGFLIGGNSLLEIPA